MLFFVKAWLLPTVKNNNGVVFKGIEKWTVSGKPFIWRRFVASIATVAVRCPSHMKVALIKK
jgi:hypothetical protein